VNEYTNFKVFYFYQKKEQMAEVNYELLQGWRSKGLATKFIWLDNAGRNELFEQHSKRAD